MSNQAYADPNPMRFKERDDNVKDINPSQNMINQLSQKYKTNNVYNQNLNNIVENTSNISNNPEFKIPSEIPFSGFNQDTRSQDNLNTNWRNIDHYHHNNNN